MALFDRAEARDFAEPEPTAAQHLQHLVLQAGISLEEHWVEWCERASAELA